MLYHLDKTHPRVVIRDKKSKKIQFINYTAGKPKFVKHPICDTKTGWAWCTKEVRSSEFTNYGVGVTLYFQFLKFLSTAFAILTILSLPAFIFYKSGS